jgi:hypothetical protein
VVTEGLTDDQQATVAAIQDAGNEFSGMIGALGQHPKLDEAKALIAEATVLALQFITGES